MWSLPTIALLTYIATIIKWISVLKFSPDSSNSVVSGTSGNLETNQQSGIKSQKSELTVSNVNSDTTYTCIVKSGNAANSISKTVNLKEFSKNRNYYF